MDIYHIFISKMLDFTDRMTRRKLGLGPQLLSAACLTRWTRDSDPD